MTVIINPFWVVKSSKGFNIKSKHKTILRNISSHSKAYQLCGDMNQAYEMGYREDKTSKADNPYSYDGNIVMRGNRAVCVMDSNNIGYYVKELNKIYNMGLYSNDKLPDYMREDWEVSKPKRGW